MVNKITWKQLAERIGKMTKATRETNATVLLMEQRKAVPVSEFITDWDTIGEDYLDIVEGTIDDEHPFLTFRFGEDLPPDELARRVTWNIIAEKVGKMTIVQQGTDITFLLPDWGEVIAAVEFVTDWSVINKDCRAVAYETVTTNEPFLMVNI